MGKKYLPNQKSEPILDKPKPKLPKLKESLPGPGSYEIQSSFN